MRKSILYDNDLFTFSGHLAAEIGINEAGVAKTKNIDLDTCLWYHLAVAQAATNRR